MHYTDQYSEGIAYYHTYKKSGNNCSINKLYYKSSVTCNIPVSSTIVNSEIVKSEIVNSEIASHLQYFKHVLYRGSYTSGHFI